MILTSAFIVLIFALILFLHSKRRKAISNLPPEVWSLPLIGSMHWFLHPHWGKLWAGIGKKYGPIVHTHFIGSFEMVLLNGADTIKEAFKVFSLNGRCENMYKEILENKGIIWPDDTREQRKFIQRNARHFEFFGPTAENNIHEEITTLFEHFDHYMGKPFAVRHTFNIPTMNIVSHLLLGYKIPHDDAIWADIVKRMIVITELPDPIMRACVFIPSVEKWVPSFLSGKDFVSAAIKDAMNLIGQHVEPQRKTHVSNQPRHFADAFIDKVEETEDETSVFHPSQKSMNPVILDLLTAAIETTSSMLEWTVLYLSHYPEVQKKLQAEIDDVIAQDRFPTSADKANMPYLQAVLQELYRIAPPIAFGFHMATEDTNFNGYTIKKGSHVIGNFYGVHMDPEIWGNPNDFCPERFIDEKGAFVKSDLLLTFGTGRRYCLGESMAREQLFLFASRMFQAYTVEPEKRLKSFIGNIGIGNHCTDFKAKFVRRV